MKILIQNPIEPMLEGITQVLASIGETLIIWDNKNVPLNDLMDRYHPELMFCYNGSIEKKQQAKFVMIDNTGKDFDPNIVDLICTKNEPNNKSNEKYLYVKTAANLAYHTIQYDQNYATDIFYYSQNTTPQILEHLLEIEKHYQLKIIGQHRIPIFSYLGVGTADDIVKFMKSCKIALAFDLSSVYTYAANKIFCVTNQENNFYPTFTTPMFSNDVNQCINTYLNNKFITDDTYKSIINHAYEFIVSNHTYFHRTHNILTRLGYNEQAEKCLTQLNKIIEQIQ